MKFHRVALLAAVLCLIGSSLLAQQQPAPAKSGVVIQTQTRVVLVDAVVTDKKGYVRDLKTKDFQVFEDNKEQPISSFAYEADPASGKAQRHYIILFFDVSHMELADQPRARQAAEKFIESTAGPNRMMGVVNFNGTMQLATNFTDNVERLKKVVSGVKPDLLGGNEAEAEAASDMQNAASTFGARTAFLALRSLADGLRNVPGRKSLIYLSADYKLPPDRAEFRAAVDACHRANVAIYSLDARGLVAVAGMNPPPVRPENAALASGRRALLQLASFATGATLSGPSVAFAWQGVGAPSGNVNKGDWSSMQNQAHLEIAKVPDTLLSQDALQALAEETGGFAIHNTNDLAGGLDKIGKEQSEYYLLGYTPPESVEGSCHKLRVKVDRGGTTVRARAEYCVEKSQDMLAGSPVEKELENRVAAPPAGSGTAAFMEAPFFYTSPKVARVNLAIEMPADKLKPEKQKGKYHAEINVLGIAYRPDGSVGARFSDLVKLDFEDEKRLGAFTARPLYYENQFDVAPGVYTLKVAFSMGGEGFGKVEMPLSVDPYDSKQFSMSGLAISKQYAPVADPRANLSATVLAGRTPLIAEGLRFFPSASNRFKNTDPAVLYTEIYEPLRVTQDPKTPLGIGAAISIVDRKTGDSKADTGVVRVKLPEAEGNPMVPVAFKVPLGSLPPGSYRLEFEAGDSAGKTAKRTADFEIE